VIAINAAATTLARLMKKPGNNRRPTPLTYVVSVFRCPPVPSVATSHG
jgi:hypothetical protein